MITIRLRTECAASNPNLTLYLYPSSRSMSADLRCMGRHRPAQQEDPPPKACPRSSARSSSRAAPMRFRPRGREEPQAGFSSARKVARAMSPSPVEKYLVGTNNENPRDPKHQGDRSISMCFYEKTGESLGNSSCPSSRPARSTTGNLGLLAAARRSPSRAAASPDITSKPRCEVLRLDINGMADGNDGPFKDEAKYVVKDVVLDKGKPTEEPRPTPSSLAQGRRHHLGLRHDGRTRRLPHNASNGSLLIVVTSSCRHLERSGLWTHSNIPSPNALSFISRSTSSRANLPVKTTPTSCSICTASGVRPAPAR